ncbi:thioredoxin family protein [Methylorubrum salsuginis]|uniref:SoxS protein n=1 Tax=Methylorubrum salsuginis TaxID=414703 RepID=A0A1I4E3B5_9HYPH|nr:thioredoxin family protein [Methylorubrum salsuginis]SFK99649.1 hypothetical protein SAMN04488125_10736 [Methylorubrum salsuginis]
MRATRRSVMVLTGGFLFIASNAMAAELVLFELASCPWCTIWNRTIGPIYPKSEVGRRAPLRRVALGDGIPAGLTLKGPIRYTPTFVLVEEGREVDRIEGYSGEDFFWARIEALVGRRPPSP